MDIDKITDDITKIINDGKMSTTEIIANITKKLTHRPSWEEYFMSACHLISQRSACDRLHVGCILVKNNHIVACGYNGFIAGAPHKSIIRDNHEQMTIHAETNAISDSAKRGVSLDGCTAYITHFPCINCTKILIASGIKKIIYYSSYKNDELVPILCKDGNVELLSFVECIV